MWHPIDNAVKMAAACFVMHVSKFSDKADAFSITGHLIGVA